MNAFLSLGRYFLMCCLLLFIFTAANITFTGCGPPSSQEPTRFTGIAMTIPYRILIGERLDRKKSQRVQQIIDQVFQEVDETYNDWNPESELSKLNRLKAGEALQLSPLLAKLLKQAGDWVALTEGRFDPTVRPLVKLWQTKLESGIAPTDEEIKTLMPSIGWHNLSIQGTTFIKNHDETQLDLGGIAKGACVDQLVEELNTQGYPHVYVEWGGEIRTSGQHPGQRPWRVFISHLGNPDPSQAIEILELREQGIATSGDYHQQWNIKRGGTTACYTHIIDPRTGYPLAVTSSSISSVTVLAPSCCLADALATAAMLFDSPEECQAWLAKSRVSESVRFWLITH